MADNRLRELLQQGVAAARSGNVATARRLLEQVIQLDENNEQAWIWLATVVKTQAERRICLQKVLQINPNNATAKQALARLGPVTGTSAASTGRPTSPSLTPSYSPGPEPNRTAGDNDTVLARRLLYGVILIAIVGMVIILVNNLRGPQEEPLSIAEQATNAALERITPSPELSSTPRPTNTPPYIVVTRSNVTSLPPTFTPTFTPTATETLEPTATPLGVDQYRLLVVARADGQTETGLYRIRGDGVDIEALASDIRDVSLSFDGSQMVFVREVDYGDGNVADEVFIAPLTDAGSARQLTELRTADASQPVLSPNGQQVAFVANVDGDQDLLLLDIASDNISALTENDYVDRDPNWSRDGRFIVFTSDQDSPGFSDIYLLTFNLSGEGDAPFTIQRLTDDGGNSFSPSFSFDTTQIVYLNDEGGDADIVVMTLEGTQARIITPGETAEDRSPVWSPAGQHIIFISNRIDDRFQVYAANVETREVTRITDNDRQAQQVLFSP
ncbi:MAG: PD40 domain-containing protein [Anaerolineaceae bacterium]|nr:PD40 domain-containing protein [Anaerolineaceae bacterium]